MADEYDIVEALKAIEDELLSSMMRNMDRHRAEEDDMGLNWTMWQAEQLKALEQFKKANQKRFKKQFKSINKQIEVLIRQARANGNMAQEIAILQAIKDGFKGAKRVSRGVAAEFFRLNDRKLDALIKATTDDMEKAETAILRRANDQYRKAIYNAQVYANTGAGTYEKAVDMATKDMLASGLSCVQYANGAMHKLSEYADMAIRTASKRAYLQGEGEKRQEWGIATVIVNKRGNPCPKCLPFCGKVLIDDVWSGGSEKDGKYPLVSYAIECGLYHPRCKDSHTTYFPGISTADDEWTEKELEVIGLKNKQAAEKQYAERQAEKYDRLARYSLDEENRKKYSARRNEWERRSTGVLKTYSDVTEKYLREAIPNSHEVTDLQEYVVDGMTYKVDGKHVLMSYSQKEWSIAELLEREIGGEIYMVPRVLYPQGISTPDYIFRGEGFDLKALSGESKNLIYNAIAKKKRQANNFILDISKCPLEPEQIYQQVESIYWSSHTNFVDKLIIVKGERILRIFSRDKK